jgi:N-acetylglucosaminyldiphosphoundecaprenol N-acetyl-beta-D-mannosaminyltransferase
MIPKPPAAAIPGPPRRHILGVRVDDVTMPEAVDRVDAFLAAGGAHHVLTPNPEMVMRARRDAAFRAVLESADLAVPDGVGLRWATRLRGDPLRAVVPGSDLVHPLAERGAARGDRWFLLGAAPGVAESAGRALAARHPGLVIAGTAGGSPAPDDDGALCAAIAAAGPVHVLLVAYGAPAQDLWIARNQPRLQIPVAIGVGGTFNFLAGLSPAPPDWARRLGLIWLYRLLTEPWRWRRQLALVPFAALALGEALAWRVGWRREDGGATEL